MGATQPLHSAGISVHRDLGSKANASDLPSVTDSASVLSEVATSDVAKLANILDPAPDQNSSQILDSLLNRAVQEVAKGNAARAVGYLADYATRDPRRAETLPLQPELEPVRDKIDSMVSRMAEVAKMSAENGLSHAETISANAGNLPDWETHADVLLKVAHRIFEAGGYANYSRTSNLARAVTDAVSQTKHAPQALAASASAASAGIPMNQAIPTANIPYWASTEWSASLPFEPRRAGRASRDNGDPKLLHLRGIGSSIIHQLWIRAPLLLFLLTWFFLGLWGGVVVFVASKIWPDGAIANIGDFGFELWGLGFLALVGFGFFARVRRRV